MGEVGGGGRCGAEDGFAGGPVAARVELCPVAVVHGNADEVEAPVGDELEVELAEVAVAAAVAAGAGGVARADEFAAGLVDVHVEEAEARDSGEGVGHVGTSFVVAYSTLCDQTLIDRCALRIGEGGLTPPSLSCSPAGVPPPPIFVRRSTSS